MKIIKFINRIITNRESPEDWIKNFEFKRNSRHGNTIKIRKNRINFCDNNIFDYSIKLYNSFPVYIRKNDNFLIHLSTVKNYLYETFLADFN